MKPIAHALSCLTAATLVACSADRPPSEPEPAPAPEHGRGLTDADVAAAIRADIGPDLEAHYFDAAVDLNDDGRPEVVAYVAGPMVCGTGGCALFVLTPGPAGYEPVGRITVVRTPVRVASSRTLGWRDLVVGVGGGGHPAGNVLARFDGTAYLSNPTVAPAEPLSDLAGTEVLIPDFQSYRDGKPVPGAAVSATVLGSPVHTQDAEELRYRVLEPLVERYAAEQGITVTQADKDAYLRHMRAALQADRRQREAQRDEVRRRLAADGLTETERTSLAAELSQLDQLLADLGPTGGETDSAEDKAAREEIAAAFIRQWKVNQALHRQYGGRIVYQQGGPEPLDAYRRFLEESQGRGDFQLLDKRLEAEFWRYYTDETIHSFYPVGSKEEAAAFATPPWLSKD